jgi:RNA polymerase sigma-70 factor, ECF subfamily
MVRCRDDRNLSAGALSRAFRRSSPKVTLLDEGYDGPDERLAGAEFRLLASEERAKVHEALAGLPQKDRELLRLLFIEERDKDDICEALNVDRNADGSSRW